MPKIRFAFGKLHLGYGICWKLLLDQRAQAYGNQQQIAVFIKLPSSIAQIYFGQKCEKLLSKFHPKWSK
jgi:hypothetical protein